jgi:superfamily II DNA helicase RecQ
MIGGDSGIIYCLSKKDAETVAGELAEWSGGSIKVRFSSRSRTGPDNRPECTMREFRKQKKRESMSSGGRARSSK